jgi:hypothetical protein
MRAARRPDQRVEESNSSGKYPPAEPGALDCEPLKAAWGVANAAPIFFGHLVGGRSSPQVQLVQALVLLLLVADVLSDHRLVPRRSFCPIQESNVTR